MPPKLISEAPKIRVPEALLKKLDARGKHIGRGVKMSRIQMVSLAIREWLSATDPRKQEEK